MTFAGSATCWGSLLSNQGAKLDAGTAAAQKRQTGTFVKNRIFQEEQKTILC